MLAVLASIRFANLPPADSAPSPLIPSIAASPTALPIAPTAPAVVAIMPVAPFSRAWAIADWPALIAPATPLAAPVPRAYAPPATAPIAPPATRPAPTPSPADKEAVPPSRSDAKVGTFKVSISNSTEPASTVQIGARLVNDRLPISVPKADASVVPTAMMK